MMPKKRMLILICYLLAVFLIGCADTQQGSRDIDSNGSKNEDTDNSSKTYEDYSIVETNNNQNIDPNVGNQTDIEFSNKLEYNPRQQHITLPMTNPNPDDDDILALYYQADQIAEMFENTYFNFTNDSYIEIDTNKYYKVIDDTYSSIAALESTLKTVFSEDMIKIILNNGRYHEADGELYTLCADRGGNIYIGESTYNIIRESASKINFRITAEIISNPWEEDIEIVDYDTHNMVLENLDGKWLFTQFYIFGYYDSFDEFVESNTKKL
jgi:predicted small secreted protein